MNNLQNKSGAVFVRFRTNGAGKPDNYAVCAALSKPLCLPQNGESKKCINFAF
jgi:hypothetical protein